MQKQALSSTGGACFSHSRRCRMQNASTRSHESVHDKRSYPAFEPIDRPVT